MIRRKTEETRRRMSEAAKRSWISGRKPRSDGYRHLPKDDPIRIERETRRKTTIRNKTPEEKEACRRYALEQQKNKRKAALALGAMPAYEIITPEGQREIIERVADYCEKHGLNLKAMYRVLNGDRPHHKCYRGKKIFIDYELE